MNFLKGVVVSTIIGMAGIYVFERQEGPVDAEDLREIVMGGGPIIAVSAAIAIVIDRRARA